MNSSIVNNCKVVGSLLLLMPLTAMAQTKAANQLWFAYYNTLILNPRLALNTDIQIRTKEWTKQWANRLVRTGVSYKINEQITATAGVAFFQQAQYTSDGLFFNREWRYWQELSLSQKWNSVNATQRLRAEQRNFEQIKDNGFESAPFFRLRYRFDINYPVKEGRFVLGIGNELLVHPDHAGKENFFDQNRTYAGINWQLSPALGVQTQYMAIYQKKPGAIPLQKINVIRFNLFHKLFLKTKANGKGSE